MPPNMMLGVIVGGTVFVLVAAVWGMMVLLLSDRRRQRQQAIESRLGLDNAGTGEFKTLRLWHEGREVTAAVAKGTSIGMGKKFAALCRDAGWNMPLRSIVAAILGAAFGAVAVVAVVSNNMLFGIGAGMATLVIFWVVLNRRVAKRKALFEMQLIDALELAARSLRVGHPLVSAFRLIAEEVSAPIGPIFGGIVQQQELGVPLDKAVETVAAEINSDDMNLLSTSIVIQLRSGGNLADMMERVSAVMRERMRLARKVRVLIAQTQISKQILMALPVLVFFLLNMINPSYMRPLYQTTAGMIILSMAGGGLMIGWLVMNKLSTIRY